MVFRIDFFEVRIAEKAPGKLREAQVSPGKAREALGGPGLPREASRLVGTVQMATKLKVCIIKSTCFCFNLFDGEKPRIVQEA